MDQMVGFLKTFRSQLGLLLVLAVALGGLFFLFELFSSLIGDRPGDLLSTNESADSTAAIPSGGLLIAFAAPAMAVLLSIGALLLLKRKLRTSGGRRWSAAPLGGAVLLLLGLGIYLAVSAISGDGLPFGSVDYGEHPVNIKYVTPLGLTVLAAFVVTVGLVAVTRPKFLPLPLLAWLAAALAFGMFGSPALYGVNLFHHHSTVKATTEFTGAVNLHLWSDRAVPGRGGQPGQSGEESNFEEVTGPAAVPPLAQAIRNEDEAVREAAAAALVEALESDDSEITEAAESVLAAALEDDDPDVEDAAESALFEALRNGDLDLRDAAESVLADQDASITLLENGGAIVFLRERVFWVPGTSVGGESVPARDPVFQVTGAGDTGYLRTDVGDEYTGQEWNRIDHVELAYIARSPTRQFVEAGLLEDGGQEIGPWADPGVALLSSPDGPAEETDRQQTAVSAGDPDGQVPQGTVPIPIAVASVEISGRYRPFSGTFSTDDNVDEYGWMANRNRFSDDALLTAVSYSNPKAQALPESVPERVRTLAEQLAGEYESAYEKARALAWGLRENYQYTRTPSALNVLPDGRDAVDWFLFETGKGGAGEFSSAFVVMARSVGIPARVVSGWVISEGLEQQTVYTDQAHQWAEVAFEGIGWQRFDPTPYDGAPFRANVLEVWEDERDRLVDKLLTRANPEERLNAIDELLDHSRRASDELQDVSAPLIAALATDGAWEVRAKSANTLGNEGYRNAIDALVTTLQEDEVEEVRIAAARALAKLTGEKAVDALIGAVNNDESPQVRIAAIDGLLILGGLEALDAIISALSDPTPEVRTTAAAALGVANISGGEEYQKAIDALAAALDEDEAEEVRAAAAIALTNLPGEEAVDSLIKALKEDQSERVRILAIDGLAALGDPKAIEPLVAALSDLDTEVRKAAAEVLKKFGVQVTELENGGSVASAEAFGTGIGVGMTAIQAPEPPKIPVFRVSGAGTTNYLRTSAGDIYENGVWSQLDPIYVVTGTDRDFPLALNETLIGWETSGDRPAPPALDQARYTPQASQESRITATPYKPDSQFAAGIRPVSQTLIEVSQDGFFRPYSETFFSAESVASVTWTAESRVFRIDDLTGASAYADSQYVALPDGLPARISELARTITEGETGVYARAKAIEKYLESNYSYAFYRPGGARPPPGQDPVDWFLFDHREGTCGVFSTAFVVLARSVGIPARAVSGWLIGQTDEEQTVNSDQAHQWAEVALDSIGWVTFEPTPAGGAPSRTPGFYPSEYDDSDSDEFDQQAEVPDAAIADTPEISDQAKQTITERVDEMLDLLGEDSGTAIFRLQQALEDTRPGYREAVLELLEERGASITELENGASLVVFENQGYWVPGTTTAQASGGAHNPIFEVHGAGHTGYLRTATGDVYQNGRWGALYPGGFWVYPNQDVPEAVSAEIEKQDGAFSWLPPERLDTTLLTGFQTTPATTHTDVIRMTPIGSLENFPDGTLPTSLHVQSIDTVAYIRPHSVVFASAEPVPEYTWTSKIPDYSEAQLRRAVVSSDPTYTQLPSSVPDRVRQRALDVTSSYDNAFEKAQALAEYLRTTFQYRFADSLDDAPPEGRDPVDWFLFDHQEGTCGVFSSAFVVMARSVGIPARVVSGWMISEHPGRQTVYTDQGHQWAEVAFKGVGWITFEPTASGGAPSRVIRAAGDLVHSPGAPVRRNTVTEIDRWPRQIRIGVPFSIGGSVETLSGVPVGGMEVELFINERKENGGWPLGRGTTDAGRFAIEVTVPVEFEEGRYQLIAHAIGNDEYLGSWSDPETGVYSATELQLSGPSVISVDEEGTFRGRLTEEAGAPLEGRRLRVSVQGHASFRLTTDDNGAFSFSRTFTQTGERAVTVTFDRQDYVLGNEAQLTVMVTMPTELSIGAINSLLVGEEYVIRGDLRDARGMGLAGKQVDARNLPGTTKRSVQTDRNGEFTISGVAERPGRYSIKASFAGDRVLEPSKTGYTLSVVQPSYLELTGDKEVQVGNNYVIRGQLSDGNDAPLALKQVEITLASGTMVSELTDDQGTFGIGGLADGAGKYDIGASFPGDETFQRSGSSYTLRVFEPVFLELGGDREVQVGEEYVVRGSIHDMRGTPLAMKQVLVTLPQDVVTPVLTDQRGEFEINGAANQPGRYTVKASFAGDELLEPGKTGYVLRVVEPVQLLLVGENVSPVGEMFRLQGTLSTTGGDGLAGYPLTVTRGQADPVEVETGPQGIFAWETTFEEEGEATLRVEFAGTDELDSILASLTTTVGRAEIVAEQPEPAARGDTFILRGALVISGQAVPDARIEVNGVQSARTNIAGAFLIRVPVSADADLGEMDFEVSAPGLEAETKVSVRVVSATNVLVTPVDDVRPGKSVLVEALVLDDHGVGVPGAAVHYGSAGPALTDDLGAALLTVDIPDEEGLTSVPLRVSYQGNDSYLPATYLASLAVQSGGGQGWLVWALVALTLVLGAGSGYLVSRRWTLPVLAGRQFALRAVLDSIRAAAPGVAAPQPVDSNEQPVEATDLEISFIKTSQEAANAWQVGEKVQAGCRLTDGSGKPIEGAVIQIAWGDEDSESEQLTDRNGRCSTSWIGDNEGVYRLRAKFEGAEQHWAAEASETFELRLLSPTRLEVTFATPAEDLPAVWGIGEAVTVVFTLVDDAGRGLAGQPIEFTIGDTGEPGQVFTDDAGRYEVVRAGSDLGVFEVAAEFKGDERLLPSEGSGRFEIVDFRDDVVQRYNSFLAQMEQKVPGISAKATPREMEAIVVRSGLTLDQRALEELIARFEEADYSEHAISRRQFEAAYRAWRRLADQ